MMKASSVDRVIVDTTVMPKGIAHPTDSRLLEKSRQHLVKLETATNIALRPNYNRRGPKACCTGWPVRPCQAAPGDEKEPANAEDPCGQSASGCGPPD